MKYQACSVILTIYLILLSYSEAFGYNPSCPENLEPKNEVEEIKEDQGSTDPHYQWLQHLSALNIKVKDKLGPEKNPFVATGAFTLESSKSLIDSLSQQPVDGSYGSYEQSILGKVRQFIHENAFTEKSYEDLDMLLREVSAIASQYTSDPTITKTNLFRISLALDYSLPFLYKLVPQEEVDRDGEPILDTEDKKEEKQEDKKEKEKKEPEDAELEIPDTPDDYDPHSKDTDNKDGSSKRKVLLASVRGKYHYFKTDNYNQIARRGTNRFKGRTPIPNLSTDIKSKMTGIQMDLNVPPKNIGSWTKLPLPETMTPFHSNLSKYELRRLPGGRYEFKTNLSSITIPLANETLNMDQMQLEFFTDPVGIPSEDWPEGVRVELFPTLKNKTPLEAARLVESFIRNRYLYSVDAKDTRDPIEAMNEGAFQCDLAAMIMVAILRDHLKIPSRTTGGFRSLVSSGLSKLMTPEEGHSWVEVFYQGKWHTFDPTPRKKDRAKENDSEETEANEQRNFDDETFENEFPDLDSPEDEMQKQDSNESESEGKKQEQDSDKSESEDAKQEQDSNELESEDEKQEQDSDKSESLDEGEIEQLKEDLLKELEIGSNTLLEEISKNRNPLLVRTFQILLQEIMSPARDSASALQALQKAELDFKSRRNTKASFQKARAALSFKQDSLPDALSKASALLLNRSLNNTYRRLLQISDRLRMFIELKAPSQDVSELFEALSIVEKVINEFQRLAPPDHQEIAIVKKFARELPPHSRKLFLQRYGINNIDTSPNTKTAAKDLSHGQVHDFNLIRSLYSETQFIEDTTPTPAFLPLSTMTENNRSNATPIYMPLRDPRHHRQALGGNPLLSFYDNLIQGSLFRQVRPEVVMIPNARGEEEPQRVTVGLYDTSGSMSGHPGDFQASLLAAFVDRALSDVSKNGKHRHVVQLMGFDDNVHKITPARNSAEAYDIIQHHRATMQNTSGGTNIMKALEQAFAQILDAQTRAGEPLASANIVLMSDGGSDVDLEQIKKWIAAIDRKTPLKVMFVAINGTNQKLIELTELMKEAGAKESYYREFSQKKIDEFISNSKKPIQIDKRRDFDSKVSPTKLPSWVSQSLSQAAQLVKSGVLKYERSIPQKGTQYWHHQYRSTLGKNRDKDDITEVQKVIFRFKSFIYSAHFLKDKRLSHVVFELLLSEFEQILRSNRGSLDVYELEEIVKCIEIFEDGLSR